LRVLLADDNAVARRWLEHLLRKWGYSVVRASDGDEAWQILESDDPPELALLDWMMPKVSGIEVCRRYCTVDPKNFTYIILLTAKGETKDVVEGLEAGAQDYLIKPIERAELLARLRVGERTVRMHSQMRQRVEEAETLLRRHRVLGNMLRRHAPEGGEMPAAPGRPVSKPAAPARKASAPQQRTATPTARPTQTPQAGATPPAAPRPAAPSHTASAAQATPTAQSPPIAKAAPASPASKPTEAAAPEPEKLCNLEDDHVIDAVIRGLLPTGIGPISPAEIDSLPPDEEFTLRALTCLAVVDQGLWADIELGFPTDVASAFHQVIQGGGQEPSERDLLDVVGEALHLVVVSLNDHLYRAEHRAISPLIPKSYLAVDLPDGCGDGEWRDYAFSVREHRFRLRIACTSSPVENKVPGVVQVYDLLTEPLKVPNGKGRALAKEGVFLDDSMVRRITDLARSAPEDWTIGMMTPSQLTRTILGG
jgi:CheY-like chemotaxis protein